MWGGKRRVHLQANTFLKKWTKLDTGGEKMAYAIERVVSNWLSARCQRHIRTIFNSGCAAAVIVLGQRAYTCLQVTATGALARREDYGWIKSSNDRDQHSCILAQKGLEAERSGAACHIMAWIAFLLGTMNNTISMHIYSSRSIPSHLCALLSWPCFPLILRRSLTPNTTCQSSIQSFQRTIFKKKPTEPGSA